MNLHFLRHTGSEFGTTSMNRWTSLSCVNNPLAHFVPVNASRSLHECHGLFGHWSFMAAIYPSSNGYIHYKPWTVPQSRSHLKLVSWTWRWIQCSLFAFPVTGSETSRTVLGCGRTGDSQYESRNCMMQVFQHRPKSQRSVSNILWHLCRK